MQIESSPVIQSCRAFDMRMLHELTHLKLHAGKRTSHVGHAKQLSEDKLAATDLPPDIGGPSLQICQDFPQQRLLPTSCSVWHQSLHDPKQPILTS